MHLHLLKLSYLQCVCDQALERARQTAHQIATGTCTEPPPALTFHDQRLAHLFGGVGPDEIEADAGRSPFLPSLGGSDTILLPA
ncbi:hypothetical protein ABMY26_00570 (plasmid) [Azospirillum sp. HJ39]|uniref:hypothetical protein n=1 Tax=Azospirillum sp. HJ39 TaxID=3159496 RepID=UPI003555E5D0